MMLATPMLFDFDRWGQCDQAIVAEENGDILGVVTLAANELERSRQPTLDTLYVPKRHRRNLRLVIHVEQEGSFNYAFLYAYLNRREPKCPYSQVIAFGQNGARP